MGEEGEQTMKLTIKVNRFIDEYLKDGNAARAYRAAYDCAKMNPATVYKRANEMMTDVAITGRIAELRERASKGTFRKLQDVHTALADLATTDINDIVQVRRLCCRYCHGLDHEYQWKDRAEWETACELVKDANAMRPNKSKVRGKPLPDNLGGYGFRFNLAPHPACPQCFGEGKKDVFVADTTKLPKAQRMLIQSIEQTQHGIKIKFRDRDAAVLNLGKLMGGFKKTIVLENPDGTPVGGNKAPAMPTDQQEASRVYAEFLKGNSDDNQDD